MSKSKVCGYGIKRGQHLFAWGVRQTFSECEAVLGLKREYARSNGWRIVRVEIRELPRRGKGAKS